MLQRPEQGGFQPTSAAVVQKAIDYNWIVAIKNARRDFWLYRQTINPGMLTGWWQETVARELQKFYKRWKAGQRPKLVLMSPPQHGKTSQIRDFVSWVSGHDPNLKTIFASYSNALGVANNLALQRILLSPIYQKIFPETRIGVDEWLKTKSQFEFVDHIGSFRNTTVEGPINGFGLDLGWVDDPIKGRAEARSKLVRDNVWSWFTDDFFARFSKDAALLMVMTRWHVDDPIGRFIGRFPDTQVLCWPAIATHDEEFRKAGEALFEEHKPLDFLLERKAALTNASFEAEYQQNPIVVGGEMFPIDQFGVVNEINWRKVVRSVRYFDKAGTERRSTGDRFTSADPAATAGVLMHLMEDKTIVVSHVVHGMWKALQREAVIKRVCEIDNGPNQPGPPVTYWVEQEPGSGGKESAENTIRNLAGYPCYADRVTGSKETRAQPYAAQVQGGNVSLTSSNWNLEFLNQHEMFPAGRRKDIVDAAAGAFNKLIFPKSTYDTSMRWIDEDID